MKTVRWTKYGPAEGLKIGEAEKPVPKDNEILVKIAATTVSLGDCEIRALKLPLAFSLPLRLFLGVFKPRKGVTLGQEFSGVVEQAGSAVKRFKPGDAVFGHTGVTMGAYAEYLRLRESELIVQKPESVSFFEAASMPLGGLEAKYYLERSGLGAGSKVLVIGAGGSIGTMAIQLLKLMDAEVTAVDTGAKFDVMKRAGADRLIDYAKEDYMNGELRYDGIFDVVGKTSLRRGLVLLRPGGVYMHANPKISQMIFRRFYVKQGKMIVFKSGEQTPADLQYLADLMETREAKPLIDKVMPLQDIAAAHRYVEAGKKKGNLVIAVSENAGAR